MVWRCLDPDPLRRYQTGHELIDDIQRHLNYQPLRHAPERSLCERTRKWLKRHPRLMSSSTAIIALEAIVIVALLVFGAARRQHVSEMHHAPIGPESTASSPGDPSGPPEVFSQAPPTGTVDD
jgi:hypothetical protein